jgi:uncharacterized membrane protein YccF (DUF307 family)
MPSPAGRGFVFEHRLRSTPRPAVSIRRLRTCSSPPIRHDLAVSLPPPQSDPTRAPVLMAPGRSGPLRTIGNVLWLVLAGIWMAVGYLVAGVVQCITIIGIPFGIQSFKLAGFALWPFGRVVVQRTDRDLALSCLGNVVWIVLGGIWLALGHLITGVILCLTIIGIPFGIASFKLAGLALVPFGKLVVKAGTPLPANAQVYLAL